MGVGNNNDNYTNNIINTNAIRDGSSLPFTITQVFLVVIYEIGTLQESNWNVLEYISNGWNILDGLSSSLVIIAFYLLVAGYNREEITVGGLYIPVIMIASAAIPIALTILQPLSLFKPLGELIIMIKEMSFDVISFFLLYIICSFGFAVLAATIISQSLGTDGDLIGSMLYLYRYYHYHYHYHRHCHDY